jgi:hypothetical protein
MLDMYIQIMTASCFMSLNSAHAYKNYKQSVLHLQSHDAQFSQIFSYNIPVIPTSLLGVSGLNNNGHTMPRDQDSAIGIAAGYRVNDRKVRVRPPVGSRISSSSHHSVAHHASYPNGTGDSFLKCKVAETCRVLI